MTRVPPRRAGRAFGRVLAALLVLAVATAAGAALVAARVRRPFKAYDRAERFVEIPRGASVPAIATVLAGAGIVPDPLTFRIAVRVLGADRTLKAGEYRFTRPLSPLEVAATVARGEVYLRTVTFPEGLTIVEMARVYEARGLGGAQAFVAAARDASAIGDLDSRAADLEGYLFPDTYALPRSATARDLTQQMVTRFRDVFGRAAIGRLGGRTVRQVVTLASLVEKETALPDERGIVAGVYANRLRIGMGLQCDPTVIYALARAGRYAGNLTRADLALDSPYNTYRYAGLPPGPIASPGKAALEAALQPAEVPYLYFVSRNDGGHVFAATLEEHNRNVQRYQVEYFRAPRDRERVPGGAAAPPPRSEHP